MTLETMCALRIYMKRGDNAAEKGFFRRMFKRPLSTVLLQQALLAGVTHASVSLGHTGFARGARSVSSDITEIPMTTLPVCLEIVGPKPLLEQFIRDHAKHVTGATLVMLEGVHVLPQVPAVDMPHKAHHVEYVKADGVTVSVDHVDVSEDRDVAIAG